MRESTMYTHIKNALKDDYFIQRVENVLNVGTPDVFFSSRHPYKRLQGWIELKAIERLPCRDTTAIKVPFRPGQYAWYKKAREAHINYFLLIWTPKGFFIFGSDDVKRVYSQDAFFNTANFQSLAENASNTGVYSGLRHYLNGITEWHRQEQKRSRLNS